MSFEFEERILSIFARYPNQLFRSAELARRLGIKDAKEIQRMRDALNALDQRGLIRHARHGKYGHLQKEQVITGALQMTKQGFGYVVPEHRTEETVRDIIIRAGDLGGAIDGDVVEVRLFPRGSKSKEQGGTPAGEIVRIVKRSRTIVVGTVYSAGRELLVAPDDTKVADAVVILGGKRSGVSDGDKVVVEIARSGETPRMLEGKLTEVLGKAGEVLAEMKSVLREYGLNPEFPKDVNEEASHISAAIPDEELHRRLDLRNLLCATIDPEDAKDFDDALSLEDLGDGIVRLGVHIADVSYYVQEGSALDEEAFARGTSVYLPSMVVPMLPHRLSSDICSLRPGVDRLTYSVRMEITPRGKIQKYEIRESVIRSARRFTYEEVEAYLDGSVPPTAQPADDSLVPILHSLHKLSALFTKKRMREGSIDFETAEAKFTFDDKGMPVGLSAKTRLKSHRLVEECMLLANQTVARHIGHSKGEEPPEPFLYRVHDLPDRQRLEELSNFVRQFGYSFKADKEIRSKDLQKLLDAVRGSKEENVINEVALRSMAKAVYSERNIGHYGLGFQFYSHFTSPIRRYPDLVVHRLLKKYAAEDGAKHRKELLKQLAHIAKHSSDRERHAVEAERDAVRVMQVEYMKSRVGEEFEGIISGVVRYGFFVEITGLLVEGMVHVRDLEDDYYLYDEKQYALIGQRSRKRYRLGDTVKVRLIRAKPEERELDFRLVLEEPPAVKKRRR